MYGEHNNISRYERTVILVSFLKLILSLRWNLNIKRDSELYEHVHWCCSSKTICKQLRSYCTFYSPVGVVWISQTLFQPTYCSAHKRKKKPAFLYDCNTKDSNLDLQ